MKADLNRAVESLTRALQLNPQSAEAHAQLAEVLMKQGKPEPARQHAAEAERLRKATPQ
jgi:Flp pilus assembly protein TadD